MWREEVTAYVRREFHSLLQIEKINLANYLTPQTVITGS